jgi:hypothetical protein
LLLAPGDCWGIPDYFPIGFAIGGDWYSEALDRFSAFLRTNGEFASGRQAERGRIKDSFLERESEPHYAGPELKAAELAGFRERNRL